MVSVGLPGSMLFLANSNTELLSQHYLCSTTASLAEGLGRVLV
jgi:hypothetical protein